MGYNRGTKKGFKRPPRSAEWSKKISESHKKAKIIPPSRKGAKMSDEARLKISKALKGRKKSEATKKRISESRKGRFHFKHTPEAIEKIRIAGTGRKDSVETRFRKSRNSRLRGAKSPHWKGGISSINKVIRESLEYRIWRESVFERDNWTCVWCGVRSGNGRQVVLNADHIKRFADYPELRFELSNGRTLCVPCHRKTPTYGCKEQAVL